MIAGKTADMIARKNPIAFLTCALVYLAAARVAPAECPQTCDVNTAFGTTVTSGVENTVVGSQALGYGPNNGQNTIVGSLAGFGVTGNGNTCVGDKTMNNNIGGDNNTALGYAALSYCGGDNNIGIGSVGGTKITSGSNNIEIGNQGTAEDHRIIRIGNVKTQEKTFVAGISGVTLADGVEVVINGKGQLGTLTSSARFKDDIRPMSKASEALFSLRPVTFRYKKELDGKAIPQFGLVAEQVEKVDPDLVARDEDGKPYSVRYEAVNAMMLNEFLKEHQTVSEQTRELSAQRRKVESLETALAQQQAQIKLLTAGLQKVSAEIQTTQVAPRLVSTGH